MVKTKELFLFSTLHGDISRTISFFLLAIRTSMNNFLRVLEIELTWLAIEFNVIAFVTFVGKDIDISSKHKASSLSRPQLSSTTK
jgi:hypothetical protein